MAKWFILSSLLVFPSCVFHKVTVGECLIRYNHWRYEVLKVQEYGVILKKEIVESEYYVPFVEIYSDFSIADCP